MPERLRGAPVFSVGARTITWGDVVAHAGRTGGWGDVEREVALGRSCLQTLAERGERLPADAVKHRAAEFRYARGLFSGEETESWLAGWAVSVGSWTAYIRRTLAGERCRPTAMVQVAEPGDAWTTAVCSGALARFATGLAGRLAVHERIGGSDPETSMAALRAEVATASALAALIQARALDWTRVDAEILTFAHDDAAREALMCLTHDGLETGQVALLADVPVQRRSARLADVEPAQRDLLVGARAGDLVGPLGGAVIKVGGRQFPTPDDPEIRRLAEQTVTTRAVQREIDDRVVWHVDL